MAVVRLTLAYDGSDFRGWARQREQRTVEGVLEDALFRVLGRRPELSVAGRTDAGVHARGQVASFRWPEEVDVWRLQRAVNAMLAPEVVVLDARPAPEGFDARFSATAREYRYRIDLGAVAGPVRGAVRRGTARARRPWPRCGPPRAPWSASTTSRPSAAVRPAARPRVRRLERLSVARTGDRLEISARANAFLHQMVRSLVGTLVAVGDGARDPDQMAEILASGDRRRAGHVAPAHGLCLERVVYGRR